MRKINIHIDKAVLNSISLRFEEDNLIVNAAIDLYAGNTKVSSFDIGTSHWKEEAKFDLPLECISSANDLREALEPIIVSKCMAALKQLPAPKEDNVPF